MYLYVRKIYILELYASIFSTQTKSLNQHCLDYLKSLHVNTLSSTILFNGFMASYGMIELNTLRTENQSLSATFFLNRKKKLLQISLQQP